MMKIFFLLIIIALGVVLRLQAVSPFKIYPDSYQSLLVAENIQHYQSVIGYLGPEGMLYPDFFSWTRPGYPLLILLGTLFTRDSVESAQYLSLLAGIAAIPFAFLLLTTIFRSSWYGIFAALLLSLSFHHSVWGGFIMTETLGVLSILILLTNVFSYRKNHTLQDILTGLLLGSAVLLRYEYIILVLPLLLLFFLQKHKVFQRATIFLGALLLFVSLSVFRLFPYDSLITVVSNELKDFFPVLVVGFVLFPLLLFALRRYLTQITVALFIFICFCIVSSFFNDGLIGIRGFVFHDVLIVLSFLVGCITLRKKQPNILFFILFSITILYVFYYMVNPTMDRYLTHLIPFFLIPASYGLNEVFLQRRRKKRFILLRCVFILFILLQIGMTYYGFRLLQDSSWFRTSYEEQVARLSKQYILEEDVIIIVAQPEPYFYILETSTQSITQRYPYLAMDETPNNTIIYLIQDTGMRVYFPEFSAFLEKSLQEEKIAEFKVSELLHVGEKKIDKKKPVIVYKTTIEKLKKRIKQQKNK